MEIFCLFPVLTLLFVKFSCAFPSAQKYSRIIIQSSSDTEPRTQTLESNQNGVWETKGFIVRNVSVLLKEHYTISPPPSSTSSSSESMDSRNNVKNASKVFCSNKTASLTILIKDFTHPIMFINFSYYIEKSADIKGTLETSAAPSTVAVPTLRPTPIPEQTSKMLVTAGVTVVPGKLEKPVTETQLPRMEGPEKIKSPQVELRKDVISVSDLNTTARNPIQGMITEPSIEDGSTTTASPLTEEPIALVHDMARRKRRRRRSVDHLNQKNNSEPINTSLVTTTEKTALEKTVLVSNSSTSLDSLTLVEAVEMIKSAAAVVAAAGITSGSVPNTGIATSSVGAIPTGRTVISEISKTNESMKELGEMKRQNDHSTHKLKSDDEDNELKLGSVNNKNEKRHHHRKNKGAKQKHEKQAERNEKNSVTLVGRGNNDEETEKLDESSSSSSSSEEEEEIIEEIRKTGTVPGKKRISYKTWRASLEKKNRPPGLYLTVNEDIVFDNWEGIWDKAHVLGKWSGSKASLEDSNKWNQTYIFMNWEDAAVSHDIKIVFEWEPFEKHTHIILSDIVVSTISTPSNCSPAQTKEKEMEKNDSVSVRNDKEAKVDSEQLLSDQARTEPPSEDQDVNATSFFVVKQNSENKGIWHIIKAEKKGSKTVELENVTLVRIQNSSAAGDMDFLGKVVQALDSGEKTNKTIHVTEPPATTKKLETLTEPANVASEEPRDKKDVVKGENHTAANIVNWTTTTTPSSPTLNPTEVSPSDSTTPVSKLQGSSNSLNIFSVVPTQVSNITSQDIVGQGKVAKLPTNEEKPKSGVKRGKKTDSQTALVMSIITGCIALAILVLTIKKRIDISTKGRNATR